VREKPRWRERLTKICRLMLDGSPVRGRWSVVEPSKKGEKGKGGRDGAAKRGGEAAGDRGGWL
jgi:hypothetical protein